MDLSSFFFLFFNIFILFPILFVITKHFLNKIRNLPPSPFPSLPILGHLYLIKKPLYRTLSEVSAKHGPLLLLNFGSRPVLLVSSISAAEECFTKNDIVFANRPRMLAGKHLGNNYTSFTWAPYGDHWRNLRRIASVEMLATRRLQAFQVIRDEETKSLLDRLSRSKSSVDMKSAFFELMLNVMMRMIAGKRYYGEDLSDAAKARTFQEIVAETSFLNNTSNLGDLVPLAKWLGGNAVEQKMIALRDKRDKFVQELIEEHRSQTAAGGGDGDGGDKSGKKDMIDLMLSLQKTEPDYYTDEIIRGLLLNLLVAGTDTSVGTMEWALSLLVNNPDVIKKAQIEIDNNVGHDRLFNESDIANLPYLRCIINETMRMYPPSPLLLPHESSVDCEVGGYLVPGGTMLFVNLWGIHNDPKLWPEPRVFKPERFEGIEGTRDGFRFMPFGSGRRVCPGEGLAVRTIGLVLGSLLQSFDCKRVGKELVDMAEGTGLTMPKLHPLMVEFQSRSPMTKQIYQS